MKVLIVDIGGSHIKILATGQTAPVRFDSFHDLKPHDLMTQMRPLIAAWEFDFVSVGYPGRVDADGPVEEPGNLGNGWVGFDFHAAFRKPVRVVNDAAMQALGAYDGGRMLFLGLGTGLGSALVTDRVIIPLELGSLPFAPGETMAERLGKEGLERFGRQAWEEAVVGVAVEFRRAFLADYLVIGGGNSSQIEHLPACVRRGGNEDAFVGGIRLWQDWVEPHDRPASSAWRVVR